MALPFAPLPHAFPAASASTPSGGSGRARPRDASFSQSGRVAKYLSSGLSAPGRSPRGRNYTSVILAASRAPGSSPPGTFGMRRPLCCLVSAPLESWTASRRPGSSGARRPRRTGGSPTRRRPRRTGRSSDGACPVFDEGLLRARRVSSGFRATANRHRRSLTWRPPHAVLPSRSEGSRRARLLLAGVNLLDQHLQGGIGKVEQSLVSHHVAHPNPLHDASARKWPNRLDVIRVSNQRDRGVKSIRPIPGRAPGLAWVDGRRKLKGRGASLPLRVAPRSGNVRGPRQGEATSPSGRGPRATAHLSTASASSQVSRSHAESTGGVEGRCHGQLVKNARDRAFRLLARCRGCLRLQLCSFRAETTVTESRAGTSLETPHTRGPHA